VSFLKKCYNECGDTMQRYFINETIESNITLHDESVIHHVFHVMRMKIGDEIVLCDLNKQCYAVKITEMNPNVLKGESLYPIKHQTHPLNITLGQALIKKDKFELVIQKASELGVNHFLSVSMARSIVKIDEKIKHKKVDRFKKIAKEAAEQTRRNDVMSVGEPTELHNIDYDLYDHVLVAYESEQSKSTKKILKTFSKGSNVLILIGPEGGFNEQEIAYLKSKGALSISLGPRILRSETAAFYILSALSYELEMSVES